MTVIETYAAQLSDPEKSIIEHMYDIIRHMVPDATEELSYAMPAFKYKGKGLVAIIANKKFISLYPFCAVDSLGIDISAYEHTSGSIHFSAHAPISDDLLRKSITARMKQINMPRLSS